MPNYTVTIDFTCTISIDADNEEDAEAKASEIDATEVITELSHSGANVIHVEESYIHR